MSLRFGDERCSAWRVCVRGRATMASMVLCIDRASADREEGRRSLSKMCKVTLASR